MDFSSIITNGLHALIGLDAVYFALLAIGLNIHFGYSGLLNFGQVGFAAVGAYGVAMSVSTFGLPFWVGIIVGLLAGVVLGLLLGLPTLRLRADYLAITTIAASEILRLCFRSVALSKWTGGSDGLNQFANTFTNLNPFTAGAKYGYGPFVFSAQDTWSLLVGWTLVGLCVLLVFLLMRSPWGRVLKAIREDEDAARSLGKNVYWYKMQALVLGGVIGSLGGMFDAIQSQSVQPDLYGTPVTFFAYAVLILGGAARVLGPVVGAMIFWFLLSVTETVLGQLVSNGYITFLTSSQAGQVRYMLVGLGLILLMAFRPQGIFGDRREIALDAR
jgi:branched-chain amino acid transport system permease protein